MGRFRVSIAGMMALVVALGLAFASLRFPSEAVAGAVLLATLGALAFAVLAIVYRAAARRAFWLGFVLFGWGYMALAWESWRGQGAIRPGMFTTITFDRLGSWLQRTNSPTSPWPFANAGGRDFQNRKMQAKLEEPISMPFPTPTPLSEVIDYIRNATRDAKYNGIPIYVDPVGLSEAGKTMTSTVELDLEGIPLKTTLRLVLHQVGLDYDVQDGLVKISNTTSPSNTTPFQLLGHCYFALLAAFCGGCAGRILHNSSRTGAE